MTPRFSAALASLPLAAGATFWTGRLLPLEFRHYPNDLGIVSQSEILQYPVQQETFWLVFCVALGSVLAWGISRALCAVRATEGACFAVETLGAAGFLASLWLPPAPGLGVWLASAVAAAATGWGRSSVLQFFLSRRSQSAAETPQPPDDLRRTEELKTVPVRRALLWILIVALASLYAIHDATLPEGFWGGVRNVVQGYTDRELARDTFVFHAEQGQHLYWADALREGRLPGRDFFTLYGPLFDLGFLALEALAGRSLATWTLYHGLLLLGGALGLVVLGFEALRRRVWLLALPLFAHFVHLRTGLGFIGIALLVRAQRTGSARSAFGAGAVAGVALLFSQEFGLALLVVSVFLLALRAERRPGLLFAAGILVPVAPICAWLAWGGALGAVLADLVSYPLWVMAGYGDLPFPALATVFPLRALPFERYAALRSASYALPLICVGGALLTLPVSALEARRPLASLAAWRRAILADPPRLALLATALFGLLAYRSALARNDVSHTYAVMGAPALLVCAALERIGSDLLRRQGPALVLRRRAAALRAATLGAFLLCSGLPGLAKPVTGPLRSLASLAGGVAPEAHPPGSQRVDWLVLWIAANVREEERVLFLPDAASYYYMTERRAPTRFVLAHQMVTSAHRAEALRDLRARPPQLIVIDTRAWNVDKIPLPQVLGPDIVGWIREQYRPAGNANGFEILVRRDDAGPGEAPG